MEGGQEVHIGSILLVLISMYASHCAGLVCAKVQPPCHAEVLNKCV